MRRRWLPYALIVPGSVWLILFYVVPLGYLVATSLAVPNVIGQPIYGFHTDNYSQVFQSVYLEVVWRTIVYAGLATLIALVLAYPTAYLIARFGGRYRLMLVLATLLPWFVDYLIRIAAWLQLLADHGEVNAVLQALDVSHNPIRLINNEWSVVGGLVYTYLPFLILPIYLSLEQFDMRILRAAKDLYAGPRTAFMRVTLPMTRQGVLSGCIVMFLLSVGDFATAEFLGGPDQFMLGNLIQSQFTSIGSLPFAAALTTTLLAVVALAMILVVVIRRLLARSQPVGEREPQLALEGAAL